ncbi:amidase [Methylobacterium frigidaeris]|uniref:Acylamidase n=1 Tax=Methylobacterium frigidaeris TaxID=2038277 RepID=A0AA37HCE3_9HYPH|nr:amidase [Methylobacterium frigidaeris]PIK68917.1 amidase [Methylobacterium frigidaeris]GJD62655.1 Acylamidase [Methylobacterium frigidaeris]
MSTELWRQPALELGRLFASGRASPVDALEAAQARAAAWEPHLNAIARENPGARAEAEASAARWRAGTPLSALDGVPMTVKEFLVTEGMPSTYAEPGEAPPSAHDELPVARARRAGLVTLAKTTMPEFAVQGYTATARFGVTRNPWNVGLTPGGSTGGGAAATAAGYAPIALGTDGGGSLRRPAAHTGLVGLKSSLGRVPRLGGLPSPLLDFEVAGALTRTVADSRAVLALLQGADPRVLWSTFVPDPRPARPLRARYVERIGDAPLDPVIAASCRRALADLEAVGVQVEEGPLPFEIAGLNALWPEIGKIGLARLFEADRDLAARASAPYRAMAEEGARAPATLLAAIIEKVQALRNAASAAFADLDLVVTPSAAAMPWAADAVYPEVIDGQPVGPRGHAVYSGWVNAAALPGLSLPVDPAPDGMPIGLHLVAGFGRDDLLLDVAETLERRSPFADRWPELPGTTMPEAASR